MKRVITLLPAVALFVLFSVTVFAQNTATSSAVTSNAHISKGLSISAPSSALDFGSIVASVGGGTVVLSPANVRTVGSGTITLVGQASASAVPTFTVTGEPGYIYAITYSDPVVLSKSGATDMPVTGFTAAAVSGTLGHLDGTSGTQDITVGATVTVNANQASGNYTGTFTVTVTYN
jgi:hypothetical protein